MIYSGALAVSEVLPTIALVISAVGLVVSALVSPTVVAIYALRHQAVEHAERRRLELLDAMDEAAAVINRALRGYEDIQFEWLRRWRGGRAWAR